MEKLTNLIAFSLFENKIKITNSGVINKDILFRIIYICIGPKYTSKFSCYFIGTSQQTHSNGTDKDEKSCSSQS